MKSTTGHRLQIGFLLAEDLIASSITLPVEMLLGAEDFCRGRRLPCQQPIHIEYCSLGPGEVAARGGFALRSSCDLRALSPSQVPEFDLVIVPSLWRGSPRKVQRFREFSAYLRHWHQQGSTIVGVGTGVSFLAETGLLDGRVATTHWHCSEPFKRHYSRVHFKDQYFITQADNLVCVASINALADFIVHWIRQHFDLTTALHVERTFSHEIRRPYEQQRFRQGDSQQHSDEKILDVQIWIQDHIDEKLSLERIAQAHNISRRTLTRRFRDATEQSPAEYILQCRVKLAMDYLKNSDIAIGDVASRCGFQDISYFTKAFKRLNRLSPRDYRKTVRSKLFSL